MNKNMQVLDKMVVFTLGGSRIVQGNKTIALDALNLSGAKPPKAVYNEGGLKTCSRDLVNPFDSIKKRADRYLQSTAVQFLNGYGTSEDNADAVGAQLDSFQVEFDTEKVRLAPMFNELQEKHFNQYPGWETTIRALSPSSKVFFDGMRLHWDAFKVGATANSALQKGIHSAAGSLFSTLCGEVSASALKIYESLAGKDRLKAGNTVIERLKSVAGKLDGISFVDPRIKPLSDLVLASIAGIPVGEALTTDRIMHLLGLCSILKDEAYLVQYGEGLLAGQMTTEGVISAFVRPVQTPVIPNVPRVAESVVPVVVNVETVTSTSIIDDDEVVVGVADLVVADKATGSNAFPSFLF